MSIRFAINSAGKNKDWDFKALSGKFRDRSGTLSDIMHHVQQGHALCAGLLDGKWRSKANFAGSQLVLLDIDNSDVLRDDEGQPVKDADGKTIKVYKHQMTLDEALEHPFIRQHCALIYTTASHRPDWHKFRLVFILPEFVRDIDTYEAIVRLLLEQLPHDPACKDGVRVFYGNTAAEFPHVNPDAMLPADWQEQAIALAEAAKAEQQERLKQTAVKREAFRQLASDEGWDTDALIQQAITCIPPRTPGSGNYDECRQVLMALADHYGDIDAEIIAEQWSPSIKGSTWNIQQKLKSFRRGGITIGTLFHIAQRYGFRFPSPKLQEWGEPDSAAYDAFRHWEDEQERLEEAQQQQREFDRLRAWANRVATRGLGFGKQQRRRAAKQQRIRYVPEQLPHAAIYADADEVPTIIYSPDELPTLLAEAKAKSWRDILDKSRTGDGKSHKYASLPTGLLTGNSQSEPDEGEDEGDRPLHRVWALGTDHRNPTTLPAEKTFTDLPVRNAGLVADDSRHTPMGALHVRWAKPGESPNVAGNCHLTPLFHKARAKGVSDADSAADYNPICAMCPHQDYCGDATSLGKDGYGFRAARAEVFHSEQRIRANLNQLPHPENYGGYAGDAAILDEALKQLQPVKSIAVSLSDFDSAWAELEAEEPDAHTILNPLRKALRPFVAGEQHQHHGYDDAALRGKLPTAPDDFLPVLEQIRQTLTLELGALAEEPDSAATTEETKAIATLKGKLTRRLKRRSEQQLELDELNRDRERLEVEQGSVVGGRAKGRFKGFSWTAGEAQKLLARIEKLSASIAELTAEIEDLQHQLEKLMSDRQTVADFNRRQRKDARQGLEQALDSLPVQWLIPFLEVWSGVAPGALRINPYGGLTVTVADTRQNEILDAMGLRTYLDATATPQMLSLYRQIPIGTILPIEMATEQQDNLKVVQVAGLGLAGKGRSESADDRIAALLTELKQRHPDLAVFDWLKKIETTGADGHWFSDRTRGTNEFADRTAIAAVGLPMPNYGAFYDLWLTLTQQGNGAALTFEDFYQQLIDAEITQAVGRLRANRRPSEQLTFYLIGDSDRYQLPETLRAETVLARDITIDAATPSERAWRAVTEFAQRWFSETGELPNQEQVAAAGGITQGYLSKLAAQFVGGWKRLKKIFQSLIDSPYRDWNIFEQPTEPTADEVWTATELLPVVAQLPSQDVAIELNSIVKSFGWAGWRRILVQTVPKLRLQLAWMLLRDGFAGGGEAIA